MSNSLRPITLGDYTKVINGRAYSQSELLHEGKYRVLRVGNFFTNSDWYYSNLELPADKYAERGDLLFAWSAGFGPKIWDKERCIYHYHIWKLLPDESVLDKSFLYYHLLQRTKKMMNATHGSTMLHITKKYMEDLVILVPASIQYQKNIANLLSQIDSKISVNETLCNELKEFANTLYHFWFVQFEYPNINNQPYKSSGGRFSYSETLKREIPDDWGAVNVGDVIKLQKGISYTSKEIANNDGLPMINLGSIDKNREYRDEKIKYFSGQVSSNKLVYPGEMLLACTDLTSEGLIIGCPIFVPGHHEAFTFSMDLSKIHITSDTVLPTYLYMTLRTEWYHKYIKRFASGTNVRHLDVSGVTGYGIEVPPIELQRRFEAIVQPIFNMINDTLIENQELKTLRDWLLPMLMNGQVKIMSESITSDRMKVASE